MEFLKSVAAVSGRLVTSVMLSLPSGHIFFSTRLELHRQGSQRTLQDVPCHQGIVLVLVCISPVVQQPLKILKECVFVLVYEPDH